jgi:ATP-dependent protease ClpP protease subunit
MTRKTEAEATRAEAEAKKALADARRIEAEAVVQEVARDVVEYDRLKWRAGDEHHGTYYFMSQVDEKSVRQCMSALALWERLKPGKEISITFSSPGGSLVEGFALFDYITMLRRKGHKVETGALGMAASMAGILLQAGDVRWMSKECQPAHALAMSPSLEPVRHGDLQPGMKILAFDEGTSGSGTEGYRRYREATVVGIDRAVRQCFEVKLSDGTTHVATGSHGWWAGVGYWLTTDHLNRNMWKGPTYVQRVISLVPQEHTWESGWMAGLLDGEGCLYVGPGCVQLQIVQNEGSVLEHAKKWLDYRGFKYDDRKWTSGAHRLMIEGGRSEVCRILMLTRPKRLLGKFWPRLVGSRMESEKVAVESVRSVGREEVVRLQTSTGTYVGDGLAMHNSWLLIHEASFIAAGKIGEVEDTVGWVKRISARILDVFAARASLATGKSQNYVRKLIKANWKRKDWWISSDEALRYGFVDEIR